MKMMVVGEHIMHVGLNFFLGHDGGLLAAILLHGVRDAAVLRDDLRSHGRRDAAILVNLPEGCLDALELVFEAKLRFLVHFEERCDDLASVGRLHLNGRVGDALPARSVRADALDESFHLSRIPHRGRSILPLNWNSRSSGRSNCSNDDGLGFRGWKFGVGRDGSRGAADHRGGRTRADGLHAGTHMPVQSIFTAPAKRFVAGFHDCSPPTAAVRVAADGGRVVLRETIGDARPILRAEFGDELEERGGFLL